MSHEAAMREALAEAKKGLGRTGPNPSVGAIFVQDGQVVARGYHRGAGQPHAEIEALNDAAASGIDVRRGGTFYVTLEPCCHQGRTPPCTEALLAAGVSKVVYGCIDPNPLVSGEGLACLRQAGVEIVGPVLEAEAQALISDFTLSLSEKRPWVVAKAGISLDGRVATKNGESKWITSEAARREARKLRKQAQAIVVGIGTVLADDPELTVRDGTNGDEPVRLVFDAGLRLPPRAKVVSGARGRCVVLTGAKGSKAREKALAARGVEILRLPGARPDPLRALRLVYKKLGFTRVFVEGGPTLLGALADRGLIDELHLFVAPLLFGGGAPSFVAGDGVKRISRALRFSAPEVTTIGDNLHLRYLRL